MGYRLQVFLSGSFDGPFVTKRDTDFHLSISISMRRYSLGRAENRDQA